MSKQERTGFRDEWISRRHRLWGDDVPIADLDFLVIEYDRCKCVALVEYKHVNLRGKFKPDPNTRALQHLATIGKIPFYVIFYDPENRTFSQFLFPSEWAKQLGPTLSPTNDAVSELEFVEFLYQLRGRLVSKKIREYLATL